MKLSRGFLKKVKKNEQAEKTTCSKNKEFIIGST